MLMTYFTFVLFLSTAVSAQDNGSLCNPFEGMCEGIFLKMEMVLMIFRVISLATYIFAFLLENYRMLRRNKNVLIFVILRPNVLGSLTVRMKKRVSQWNPVSRQTLIYPIIILVFTVTQI